MLFYPVLGLIVVASVDYIQSGPCDTNIFLIAYRMTFNKIIRSVQTLIKIPSIN